MKKIILSAAIATACVAPQAFAQSKNFEGPSVGLSANFNSTTTQIPSRSFSETSSTLGVKAAYGWGLGNNFNLTLSASYDPGVVKAGFYKSGSLTATSTAKDLTVVSIDPGFKVSNDTLVYAKFGYVALQGVLEGTYPGSANFDGVTVGLGVRSMVGKNWSIELEAQQQTFASKRFVVALGDVTPANSVLSIGVNYHF